MAVSRARELAVHAPQQVANGLDPSDAKRQAKAANLANGENLFAQVAARLVSKKRKAGKARATIEKMEWILGKVADELGHLPIATITTPQIVRCLSKQEEAGNLETAKRMRTVISEVFRYAIQTGLTDKDSVQATRGTVTTHKPKHFAAIVKPERFCEVLGTIDGYATC